MDGWIKLHRKFLEWEWKQDKNCFLLFIHLLLVACFKNTRWAGRELLAGQYICTIRRLAAETGLTENEVRGAMRKLKKTGEINIESTNKFTVVTIVNYSFYQGCDFDFNKQNTFEPQTNFEQSLNQSQTIDEHNNKNNNINNSKILFNHVYYIYNRDFANLDFIRSDVEEISSPIFFETYIQGLPEIGLNSFCIQALERNQNVLELLVKEKALVPAV